MDKEFFEQVNKKSKGKYNTVTSSVILRFIKAYFKHIVDTLNIKKPSNLRGTLLSILLFGSLIPAPIIFTIVLYNASESVFYSVIIMMAFIVLCINIVYAGSCFGDTQMLKFLNGEFSLWQCEKEIECLVYYPLLLLLSLGPFGIIPAIIYGLHTQFISNFIKGELGK